MTGVRVTLIIILLVILGASPVTATAADPARGAQLNSECSDCHGEEGLGDEDRHMPVYRVVELDGAGIDGAVKILVAQGDAFEDPGAVG